MVLATFVYDGDGNRVQSSIGGTTTTFVGNYYEVSDDGSGTTVTKYYYAGAQRIAMRRGEDLFYLLSDQLGSTTVTVKASDASTTELRYTAWGEGRYPLDGHNPGPSDYTYTGQYSNVDDFGLLYYNARWYDPYLNRWTQPDTIVPDPYNSQAWDRYSYVLNNPVRYSDPTGHKNCEEDGYDCMGARGYTLDTARQDRLFTRIFRGSGDHGGWTYKDWQYYDEHRNLLWAHPDQWIHPDSATGWDLFALHARRLASYYSADQKDEYVRDFALVFAGVPYSSGVVGGALASAHGPAVTAGTFQGQTFTSFLHEGNAGLAQEFWDAHPAENQSHHYAGIFFLAYFTGAGTAQAIDVARDATNHGDILLGNGAAEDVNTFRDANYEPAIIYSLIMNYSTP